MNSMRPPKLKYGRRRIERVWTSVGSPQNCRTFARGSPSVMSLLPQRMPSALAGSREGQQQGSESGGDEGAHDVTMPAGG